MTAKSSGQVIELNPAPQHRNLFEALAAAQGELKDPEKSKTATVKGKTKDGRAYEYEFKYADMADVLQAARPVFARHGLSISQPTKFENGAIVLITRIHWNDEVIESEYPVCSVNGDHQKMGIALTYARRYAFTALAGIQAADDTDGVGAADAGEGERVKMTASQAKHELDWEGIQSKIDGAKTFDILTKQEEWVETRRGFWPDTYYWKAKERITFNRLELATEKMAACKNDNEMSDTFADLEAVLEGKVQYEELAGIYRAAEAKLENAL